MPSLMSTSPSGAWSMFEYDLTASTSPEMRPTLASASASRSAVVTVAPRYSNTLGSTLPGTVASTSPSQPVPSAASEDRSQIPPVFQAAGFQPACDLIFEVVPRERFEGGGRGCPCGRFLFQGGEGFEFFGG